MTQICRIDVFLDFLLGDFYHGSIQQIQTANGAGDVPTMNGPRSRATTNACIASGFTAIVAGALDTIARENLVMGLQWMALFLSKSTLAVQGARDRLLIYFLSDYPDTLRNKKGESNVAQINAFPQCVHDVQFDSHAVSRG